MGLELLIAQLRERLRQLSQASFKNLAGEEMMAFFILETAILDAPCRTSAAACCPNVPKFFNARTEAEPLAESSNSVANRLRNPRRDLTF